MSNPLPMAGTYSVLSGACFPWPAHFRRIVQLHFDFQHPDYTCFPCAKQPCALHQSHAHWQPARMKKRTASSRGSPGRATPSSAAAAAAASGRRPTKKVAFATSLEKMLAPIGCGGRAPLVALQGDSVADQHPGQQVRACGSARIALYERGALLCSQSFGRAQDQGGQTGS